VRAQHLIVAVATFFAFAATAQAASLTAAERDLLAEMNRVRAAHGVPPLHVDWRLQRAARSHSAAMIARDFFSHGDFSGRISAARARGPRFGENLGWGSGAYASAGAIVRGWLESPPHRANLLRRGFVRVGVAAPVGSFLGQHARVATADFAGR
jgi:uncharacterized protein YkwD